MPACAGMTYGTAGLLFLILMKGQMYEENHKIEIVCDLPRLRLTRREHELICGRSHLGNVEAQRVEIEISRRQGARWLELRAARGYAHHLIEHDRPADARDLLEPILSWFTEGRDTMDYLYAEGLIRTLE